MHCVVFHKQKALLLLSFFFFRSFIYLFIKTDKMISIKRTSTNFMFEERGRTARTTNMCALIPLYIHTHCAVAHRQLFYLFKTRSELVVGLDRRTHSVMKNEE